jgi:hypothetical protein
VRCIRHRSAVQPSSDGCNRIGRSWIICDVYDGWIYISRYRLGSSVIYTVYAQVRHRPYPPSPSRSPPFQAASWLPPPHRRRRRRLRRRRRTEGGGRRTRATRRSPTTTTRQGVTSTSGGASPVATGRTSRRAGASMCIALGT